MNVLDTGATGTDVLEVRGTDESDDVFLLRTIESITGPLWGITPTGPAFVTLLPTGPADDAAAPSLQRVNYDSRLEQLTVDGLAGDDSFLVDGTSAASALLGRRRRGCLHLRPGLRQRAGRLRRRHPDRHFPTTETTRGWVSAGPSRPLIASAAPGDDVFTVLANAAPVLLSGGDDNDLFTVQAFALPAGGYLTHGQVLVDGGNGFDKVVGSARSWPTPTASTAWHLLVPAPDVEPFEISVLSGRAGR